MKKITIVALHLGFGGIEKAITTLSNMLCDKYDIEIVSTYRLYDKPLFKIDERVNIEYLTNNRPNREIFYKALKKLNIIKVIKEGFKGIKTLFLRRKLMIKYIKDCNSDIIISTRPLHNNWVGKYGKKGALKIAWEHSHHNNNKRYINKLVKSCKEIDYLITVSKDLRNSYQDKINSKCIYIPLSLDSIPSETSLLDRKEIVTIGRLSKEKGFLDLIDIFKIVNDKHPDWHLNMVGDGIEKNKIQERINNNKLNDVITMHGYKNKDEINKILQNSSIYVMTSFTESFGLVLIEAMSFGIPCISFSSAEGSLEIIDSNTGFIIENRSKKEMANKIIELIENDRLRKNLGNNSRKKSLLYEPDNIKKKWLELLDKK